MRFYTIQDCTGPDLLEVFPYFRTFLHFCFDLQHSDQNTVDYAYTESTPHPTQGAAWLSQGAAWLSRVRRGLEGCVAY